MQKNKPLTHYESMNEYERMNDWFLIDGGVKGNTPNYTNLPPKNVNHCCIVVSAKGSQNISIFSDNVSTLSYVFVIFYIYFYYYDFIKWNLKILWKLKLIFILECQSSFSQIVILTAS